MRKLNATLLNGDNKEEVILKIKDDSFAITTNEQIIKIPYSNIKSYNFDEQNGILSIVKFGGNPIELNIIKDKQLLELLSNLVIQNKNTMSNIKVSSNQSKQDIRNEKQNDNQTKKANEKETEKNTNDTNSKLNNQNEKEQEEINGENSNGGSFISVLISIGIFIFSVSSIISINSNKHGNSYVNTKWKTTDGIELVIEKDTCYLAKDGIKSSDICKFTVNANGTGVGKLEICNSFGSSCRSEDLTTKASNRFYFYGYEFYRQD